MINGLIENTSLPWEERIGRKIIQTIGDIVEESILIYERSDSNTLVTTLMKDGKPDMVDTYITDNLGRLIKTTNQFPGKPPHWTYEYSYQNDEIFVTRTDQEGQTYRYKIAFTARDQQGKVIAAEIRDITTNKADGRLYFTRDEQGNLTQEVIEDGEDKAIVTCDKDGRWLLRQNFHEGVLVMQQQYIR